MKVLFIHPMPPSSLLILQKHTYHYGLGIMSAVLKENGFETDLLTLLRLDRKAIRKKIREFQPDLIGLTVTSQQFSFSENITEFIHSEFGIPIIWGGVHCTVRPEECIQVQGVSAICIGEGEEPLLDLVKSMERSGSDIFSDLSIANFWFKKGDEIIKNPVRCLQEDLDSLPFCDRELVDFQALLNYHKYLEIRCSRGCPFQCSFCVNASYQNLYRNKGRYYRVRSHESILEEIDQLVNRYKNIKTVIFDDELICVNKKWTLGLLDKYKQRFDYPFNITVRADLVTEDFMQALRDAGCNLVMMGVENGDEYIRNTILNKGVSEEQIIQAAEIIKKVGIKLWTFNMVGVPYETRETIEKTIELNKRIKPDVVFVSVFYPFPGTELGDLCEEKGWISDRKVEGFFSNVTVLDQPSITKEEVAYYDSIFPWAVLYPKFLFIIKFLCKVKIGERSIYDLFFPVVKTAYEFFYRFKITLNL
ncbi:MAG: radical SAM protein [Candidatus Aminicenantes bacterium]|nr:radical SAM protein [Candidatus Aminicenantes bacterium]